MVFITTQVNNTVKYYRSNLRRFVKYLKGTMGININLFIYSLVFIHWYVGAPYGTHEGFKGHTDGMIIFGKDFVVGFSQKQKLNSNRYPEAELICGGCELLYILWSKYSIN